MASGRGAKRGEAQQSGGFCLLGDCQGSQQHKQQTTPLVSRFECPLSTNSLIVSADKRGVRQEVTGRVDEGRLMPLPISASYPPVGIPRGTTLQ